MKPAPFEYAAPRELDEALDLLAEHGDEARVLAGGQSLVRMMNARQVSPAVVIDINRVPGLDTLGLFGDNGSSTAASGGHGPPAHQRALRRGRRVRPAAGRGRRAGRPRAGARPRHRRRQRRLRRPVRRAARPPCSRSTGSSRSAAAPPSGPSPPTTSSPARSAPRSRPTRWWWRSTCPPRTGRTGSAFVELTRRHGDLPVCGAAAVVGVGDDGPGLPRAGRALRRRRTTDPRPRRRGRGPRCRRPGRVHRGRGGRRRRHEPDPELPRLGRLPPTPRPRADRPRPAHRLRPCGLAEGDDRCLTRSASGSP